MAEATRTPVAPRPFVSPDRVLAGPRTAARLGEELLAAGVAPADGPALLVGDAAVLELGLANSALAALSDAGFDVETGPGVAREPTPQTIESLLAATRGARVSAVVGIGGGSAIDAAKLAAAALTNAVALTEGMAPTLELAPIPPLVAVPTTAGTGAETTSVAMLWHEGRKRIFVHQRLVPRQAILDPELLAKAPAGVIAASGMDAISHAIESLLSSFRSPLSEARSLSALQRMARALPAAYAGESYGHEGTLLGAFEAGLGLNASVVVGHSIAYAIASRTGLSHGVTCAMALPYCLAYCRPGAEEAIAEIATWIGLEPKACAVLDWVVQLNAALEIPASLQEVGVGRDALPAIAEEIIELYPRPNNPIPLERDSLQTLLDDFHAGNARAAWERTGGREGRSRSAGGSEGSGS